MGEKTHIEWTDATWNPITGCSVVSPGCTNCYAMKLAGGRLQHHHSRKGLTSPSKAGPVWNGEVRLNEEWLGQPLHWKKPRTIFVCAHGDLFHESVPDEWIDKVFAMMALCPQHIFQVLSKRPDRMRRYLSDDGENSELFERIADVGARMMEDGDNIHDQLLGIDWPLPNVWLGVSAEDQRRADERIPDLLATPAAKRFVSAEPLLGHLRLKEHTVAGQCGTTDYVDYLNGGRWPEYSCRAHLSVQTPGIDWVIVGGESGNGARPMHQQWARDIRDQCNSAGVAFFFKQWGEWLDIDGSENCVGDMRNFNGRMTAIEGYNDIFYHVGKKTAGSLLDGVEHKEFPA